MPSIPISQIIQLGKQGNLAEAYELAHQDYLVDQDNVWNQRKMGWALYYMFKAGVEQKNLQEVLSRMEELSTLTLLNATDDVKIFDNITWSIGKLIDVDKSDFRTASDVFAVLQKLQFNPSKGYSYMLKQFLDFKGWSELLEFMDWWDFNKFLPEDYQPFITKEGRSIMALVEKAHIDYSKCLLARRDAEKTQAFLPSLSNLIDNYPKMQYPGYFYGKLLISIGADMNDAKEVLVPFVRSKATEFWSWQLLSEVFVNDPEKKLACLLRAVNCRSQEGFLKNVRIQLARLYLAKQDYARAKFHIDKVARNHMENYGYLPYELRDWVHQSWMQTTTANPDHDIDYMRITNAILAEGANESIAIVTYVDPKRGRATIVYDEKKRTSQKIHTRFKLQAGMLLRINYINDRVTNDIKIVVANKYTEPVNNSYISNVEGTIEKRDTQPFAFLVDGPKRCFISPNLVNQCNLRGGERKKAVAVLDYDKSKDKWNWVCIKIN